MPTSTSDRLEVLRGPTGIMVDVPRQQQVCEKIMSGPIDEMQKHLAEAEAEIARLKAEITELTKHVQLGAEHKKDPIWL